MKRLTAILVLAAMLLSLAACRTPVTPDPTTAPVTDAPATEVPATEAPTPMPIPDFKTSGADFCEALVSGVTAYYDLDGDGLADSVLYKEEDGPADKKYTVTVTRGAKPDEPKTYEDYGYSAIACVFDCDPDDKRLEVVFSCEKDSGDSSAAAMRVNDAGTDIDVFRTDAGLRFDDTGLIGGFTSVNGFDTITRTYLMGTHFLRTRMTVTAEGFVPTIGIYEYLEVSPEHPYELKLEMPAKLVDEVGDDGESITLPAGTKFIPVTAEPAFVPEGGSARVVIRLEDGRMCSVEITRDAGTNVLLINGLNMWDCADFPDED
ncbi:MAG: hypothetical protein K6F68_00605 [Clostridiales bacterium]|nr:hypothetical protein [Clostridiales bacterium]